ncbi:hypothetical protein DL1_08675 [Thioclava dalianensis]|uniref:NYN domain-containing protein n=2 Tax=Thioclava dalianensis TaxID=1185766 RepID=A0A074TIL1_9RHOB|nr:NYN domain-containing protein [Thioclava dalianensis]KEP68833.1 hypothetical protein DL1_08675 [Thioclava dalianensis]SFN49239.1 Uncharacterized conserved protein, LabA/DUF88 family [Thioclava dalianensis]
MSDKNRVAMIVDGANTFSAARASCFGIDWSKVYAAYHNRYNCLARYYATGTRPDDDHHNPIAKLLDWLEYNGFRVVRRAGKEFISDDGHVSLRDADVRVDITLIAVGMIGRVDEIHLWTGDGAYVPLVEALQRAGIRVSVISTIAAASDKLRRACDDFIDLDKNRELFAREAVEENA